MIRHFKHNTATKGLPHAIARNGILLELYLSNPLGSEFNDIVVRLECATEAQASALLNAWLDIILQQSSQ